MNIFQISIYTCKLFRFLFLFAVDIDENYFTRCQPVYKDEMKERYLEVLRNATGFRSICDDYSDLCKPENVDVDC